MLEIPFSRKMSQMKRIVFEFIGENKCESKFCQFT